MARKKFRNVCKECGKRFRASSKRERFCPTCKKERNKANRKKAKRNQTYNREHQKLLDNYYDKCYATLETRINYNPNKDYFEHNDEAYNENIGDDYNDIYSRKCDDEDYTQYHYKLQKLKKNLGINRRF